MFDLQSMRTPLVAVMVLVTAACGAPIEDHLAESQACFENHDQSAEDGFQKPACDTYGERGSVRPIPESDTGVTTSSLTVGRPHMHSTAEVAQSWLEPGEPFVIDASRLLFNERAREFTVKVFVDEKPAPFELFEVDQPDGYPTLEEIEAIAVDEFDMQASVEMPHNVPFNYTLAVPPHAFETAGRYQLRVLFIPRFDATNDRSVGREAFPLHRTYTVHYGSEEPASQNPWGTPRQPEQVTLEPNERELFWRLDGMLLLPPKAVFDTEDASHPSDVRLAQELTASSSSATLFLHAGGMRSMMSDTRGENLYMILQDDEIIDTFLATPTDLTDYQGREFIDGDQQTSVFPIEVELTDEPATFQVIAFPLPFEPQQYLMESRPRTSNFVMMKTVADATP